MKNNWKITVCLFKQPVFKFLILVTLLFAIYSALIYGGPIPHVFEACLTPFITGWSTAFLMLLITFISVYVTSYLKEFTILKTRFKNPMKEFENLSVYIGLSILIFIFIYMVTIIAIVILTHGLSTENSLYNIKNIGVYLPWFYIRYIIIIMIYGLLIGIISYKLPKLFSLVLGTIISFSILFYTQNPFVTINNIWELKLYFGNYFFIIKYSDFFTEIACSSLYILLLAILYCILKKVIINMTKNRIITQIKLLKKDISTLKTYKRKLFISLFLVFLTVIIIKIILKNPVDTNFYQEILGLNFINSSNIIIIAATLLYITFFIYLSMYLLCEDLLYQTEHYFLRMNTKEWYRSKLINILTITSAIKLIMHLIASIIFYIANHSLPTNTISFFIIDIVFTLLLQSLTFLIYMANKKQRLIYIPIVIIILFATELTIVKTNVYHNVFIIITTLGTIAYIYKLCSSKKVYLLEKRRHH